MRSRNVVDLRARRTTQSARSVQSSSRARATSSEEPRRAIERTRKSPTRARRVRRRILAVGAVVILIGILAYTAHTLSYTDRMTTNRIVVIGADASLSQRISTYAQQYLEHMPQTFISPRTIISFDTDTLGTNVAIAFPECATVHVSRTELFSQELTITVVPRTQYAWWCSIENTCYEMDTDGWIYKVLPEGSARDASTTPIVFRGWIATSTNPLAKQFAPEFVHTISSVLTQLDTAGLHTIGVVAVDAIDYHIILRDGSYLKVSFTQDPDTIVRNVLLLQQSDAFKRATSSIEYIDLRFGDKLYFKTQAPLLASSTVLRATSTGKIER